MARNSFLEVGRLYIPGQDEKYKTPEFETDSLFHIPKLMPTHVCSSGEQTTKINEGDQVDLCWDLKSKATNQRRNQNSQLDPVE